MSPADRELSDAAVGAVIAFVRVIELYDPAVAHRSALRAIVAERLFTEFRSPSPTEQPQQVAPLVDPGDTSVAIASAALADVDLTVSRPDDPEDANEPTRSLLGATLVGRIDGLASVSNALENHRERWDGQGHPHGISGADIPLAARVSAVADSLVGNPTAGFIPSWHHARRRVRRQAGAALDPALCSALDRIELDDIESPAVPSSTVQSLFDKLPDARSRSEAVSAATTISNAVTLAASNDELVNLFASTALDTVDAAEVVVIPSSSTQLDPIPVARVDDGRPRLPPPSRLDSLYEFSTQAELRAGQTIARNTQGAGPGTNEVITPIMIGTDVWGVLVATRRHPIDGFDESDKAVLRHIAAEMAEAISATEHWAQMEQMALRDQLTGLGNRHELYRVLDAVFERPADERVDTALIMCDVDGLKVVNDTLGHHAGDRLLIDAGHALMGAVRDRDRTTVCRIGGDEFCMVIDGGGLLTAHEVSEAIERLFERSAGSGPTRSISCGIAFANGEIDNRSSLLRAADENQYQTKRARKERQAAEVPALPAGSIDADSADRRARRD